jgi:hypothetical protein
MTIQDPDPNPDLDLLVRGMDSQHCWNHEGNTEEETNGYVVFE